MTKKKMTVLLVSALLCVAVGIGCLAGRAGIGAGGGVSAELLEAPAEIASVLPSAVSPSGAVLGRADGHVVSLDGEGNELYDTKCAPDGARISFLARAGKGVLAVDTQRRLYLLNAEGGLVGSMEVPGNFVNAVWSDGLLYVAMSGNNADLYLFCYDETFTELRSGKLYLYNADMDEMEAANIALYGMYADAAGDALYLLNDLGQIFVLPSDFSCLTKDKEAFLASGFHEVRMERPLTAVTIDEAGGRLLLVGLDRKLMTFGFSEQSLADTGLEFPNEVSKLTYDAAGGRLYVSYKLYDDVTVASLSELRVLYSFRNEFNLRSAEVSADGTCLYTLYQSGSDLFLKRTGLAALETELSRGPARTALLVLGILFLIAGAAGAACYAGERRAGLLSSGFRKLAKGIWAHKFIYLLLLPSIALLFVFCYYPSVSSLIMAFFDYRYGYPVIFNGFDNFRVLFQNPTIRDAIRNMFVFLGADLVIGILPPIIFAWSLAVMRGKRYSSAARMLLFLPGIIPGVAGILIWKNGIYGASGVLNTIIKACGGTPIAFLGDESWSLFSLVMMGFPFVGSYLIFYGAMINVPSAYYEVAELEGCGVLRRIRMIDIPFVSPQMKYVFVMSFIGSVQNVGRVMMTTQGAAGTQIPIYLMYNYLSDNNYGVAAAMALILFAVLMVATILNLRIRTADTDA